MGPCTPGPCAVATPLFAQQLSVLHRKPTPPINNSNSSALRISRWSVVNSYSWSLPRSRTSWDVFATFSLFWRLESRFKCSKKAWVVLLTSEIGRYRQTIMSAQASAVNAPSCAVLPAWIQNSLPFEEARCLCLRSCCLSTHHQSRDEADRVRWHHLWSERQHRLVDGSDDSRQFFWRRSLHQQLVSNCWLCAEDWWGWSNAELLILILIIDDHFNAPNLSTALDESRAGDDLGADVLLRNTAFQLWDYRP